MVEPINIQPLDLVALSAFYTTGASLGSRQHAEILRTGPLKELLQLRENGVIPPWDLPPPVLEGELLQRLLSPRLLLDPKDPLFDRDDISDDFKSLFALHNALTRVAELTEFATTRSADSVRAIIERQFQAHIKELITFVRAREFADITLVPDLKTDTLISPIELPSTKLSVVHFGNEAATSRTDPIAGLTGTEQFTISVTTAATTKNVLVDLAGISGTLHIDNIVSHINDQLSAAVVGTRVATERFNEFSYGIRFDVGSGETLSLSADAATESEAVYVAGSAGAGTSGSAFLVKVDDLAVADPNQVFFRGINSVQTADRAGGVAVDSKGNVYVVGTTAGDLDDQINADSDDVFLTKFDASGKEVYTRLLGSSDSASGFAVAVDGSDNVIVAGQTSALLTDSAFGGGYDTFITKFDESGQELFTRQAAPFANDGALGLAIDSSDNIFLAGFTRGAVDSDQTYGGSSDAFLTKLDSDGVLVYNKQFGDAGDETATAVAVNSSGDVFIVGTDDGNGFLRKHLASDGSLDYALDLGALGSGGGATGVAVDSKGDLYVSGLTTNAALDTTVKNAHSGDIDAFVLNVKDNPAGGTIQYVTYVGTSTTDRGLGVAVDTGDDSFYVTGDTIGTLAGETKTGDVDTFAAKFDKNGILQFTHQFGGAFDHSGAAIAFDANGTSVLSRLGLPGGDIPVEDATTVTAATTVRPGQFFYVSVNGNPAKKVTVDEDDTFGFLAFRINQALGTDGRAQIVDELGTRHLEITALNGAEVEIRAGSEGFDALVGMGLKPARLFGELTDETDEEAAALSVFELGLVAGLDLLSRTNAADAKVIIDNALLQLQKAYTFITEGPAPETPDPGVASPALLAQIEAYKSALARIRLITAPTIQSFDLFSLIV